MASCALLIPAVAAHAQSNVEVIQAAHALSAPLRDSVPDGGAAAAARARIPLLAAQPASTVASTATWTDPDLQTAVSSSVTPSPALNFEGIPQDGVIPPDTNIAVGATQAVQIVNTEFEVFDKSGTAIRAAAHIHTVFTALGNSLCALADGGDPIVLYDRLAGRWIISQLEYNSGFTTNLVCVAVSTSSDATGAYNLYSYNFGHNLPDYPKLGVWPDAYYLSANMFRNGRTFIGARACALNSAAMQQGLAANAICFQQGSGVYSLLPADLDGATPPSAGEPEVYMQFAYSGGVGNTLNLFRFHVDFNTTSNSTFSGPTPLTVSTYQLACGGGTCVPQPGTSQQLDSVADRLMYRLQYRNFGTYESLVVNHSVQVSSSSNQAGLRWYEIRNPGAPVVNQESTYSPDATTYRWMGSIAQDKAGDMAVGYSVSSSSTYPGINYAGRAAGDPLDTLGSEAGVVVGAASQAGQSRWGDYSAMSIDPVDDCTFWYTTEYSAGLTNWRTRIASFKFPGCV